MPGKNLILNILIFIKDIFINPIFIQDSSTTDKTLLLDNLKVFEEEASKACKQSYEDSSKTSQKTNVETQIILSKIKIVMKSVKDDTWVQKTDEFKTWFTNDYLDKIKK
jgi:hypothetical protein